MYSYVLVKLTGMAITYVVGKFVNRCNEDNTTAI